MWFSITTEIALLLAVSKYDWLLSLILLNIFLPTWPYDTKVRRFVHTIWRHWKYVHRQNKVSCAFCAQKFILEASVANSYRQQKSEIINRSFSSLWCRTEIVYCQKYTWSYSTYSVYNYKYSIVSFPFLTKISQHRIYENFFIPKSQKCSRTHTRDYVFVTCCIKFTSPKTLL
jgi:hypothetical protein